MCKNAVSLKPVEAHKIIEHIEKERERTTDKDTEIINEAEKCERNQFLPYIFHLGLDCYIQFPFELI